MTKIEWTDATWNPTRGCSRADDDGCRNCYAMHFAHRFSGEGQPYEGLTRIGKRGVDWAGKAVLVPDQLELPLRWRKPKRIFVDSMSDLFHESLPLEHIAAVFGVMAAAHWHTFQVLTKRPERALQFFKWVTSRRNGNVIGEDGPTMSCKIIAEDVLGEVPGSGYGPCADCGLDVRADPNDPLCFAARPWPLPNVWLGVSVSSQANADERIPLLLQCPAAVRFVSYEPALGPVAFSRDCLVGDVVVTPTSQHPTPKLDWIVVGGESGLGARPFDLAWARSTVEQCKAAGVAVFCKQLGARPVGEWGPNPPTYHLTDITVQPPRESTELSRYKNGVWRLRHPKGGDWSEWPEDLRVREFPAVQP